MTRSRKMEYRPVPIDISDVDLSPELIELTEILSENTHKVWADARIKNGWTYGPYRNDNKKETPCLVPYNALPDSEKEYDRILTVNILKAIKKLGFEIKSAKGIRGII